MVPPKNKPSVPPKKISNSDLVKRCKEYSDEYRQYLQGLGKRSPKTMDEKCQRDMVAGYEDGFAQALKFLRMEGFLKVED